MTTRPKKPAPKRTKQAANRRKDASPVNGVIPPPEHRFAPGNQAAVGHGRPRKLEDLKELILETMAEDITDERGRKLMTRAQAMIRTMLIKSPTDRLALLEYAFGKVPQQIQIDIVQQIAAELNITVDEAKAKIEQAAQVLVSSAEFEKILTGQGKVEKIANES